MGCLESVNMVKFKGVGKELLADVFKKLPTSP